MSATQLSSPSPTAWWLPWIGRGLKVVAGLALLAVLMVPLSTSDLAASLGIDPLLDRSQLSNWTFIAEFVLLAAAWNLVGGLSGYAAFGNIAFFGMGAYTAAYLLVNPAVQSVVPQPLVLPLALIAAPVVPALFAVLIGLPLLRLRGHYFAIATLGTFVTVSEVFNNLSVLGAGAGLTTPIVRLPLLFFYLMVGAAALAVLITWMVLRSRFGYGLIAIRENEDAAAVIGINTTVYKVGVFAIAAALSGLAGGIYAQWQNVVNQDTVFTHSDNVQLIMFAILGGAGTLVGPVLGAIGLGSVLQALAGGGGTGWDLFGLQIGARYVPQLTQIGLGLLLIVTVILMPHGIMGVLGGARRLLAEAWRESGHVVRFPGSFGRLTVRAIGKSLRESGV